MEITTWYLEQTDPAAIRPSAAPGEPVAITRAEVPSPEFNRFLYTTVGGDWQWTDRLGWDRQRWLDLLAQPGYETWVAYVRGTPAGYAELDGTKPGEVELAYFGLLPGFTGRGIGGHLLTVALRRAWDLPERWPGAEPTRRVWVHTCTLDGQPAALANYQRRGLAIYRTETRDQDPDFTGHPAQ